MRLEWKKQNYQIISRICFPDVRILLSGLFLLVISCNTSPRSNNTSEGINEDKVAVQTDTSEEKDSSGVIWKYTYNKEKESFEMKQMRAVDNDTLTGEALAKIISDAWPGIQVKFTGTSNDTAYVSIPDSEVLTQQMGSAGARGFMISTTWSYTELEGIQYVSFDFEYGDHAMPGVYNRNSWEEK